MMLFPVIDMKLTGEKINTLRRQRGLSVRDLQSLLGFATPQSIYKWQRGETLPAIDNLLALSRILSVPVEEIVVAECRNGGKG